MKALVIWDSAGSLCPKALAGSKWGDIHRRNLPDPGVMRSEGWNKDLACWLFIPRLSEVRSIPLSTPLHVICPDTGV